MNSISTSRENMCMLSSIPPHEQLVYLNFQLVRTNDISPQTTLFQTILSDLCHHPNPSLARGYLSLLYRMTAHTRDLLLGKGEYLYAYMMVYAWYAVSPSLAEFAIQSFVQPTNDHPKYRQPYGSWKDIKYFCDYCKQASQNEDHPLIHYCIQLANTQLKLDLQSSSTSFSTPISLVAKWIPREKSQFGWLFTRFATHYFAHYMSSAKTEDSRERAVLKCKRDYRKLLSTLNRHSLHTTQVFQCAREWSNIHFHQVTSITLSNQAESFLNLRKDGQPRHPELKDRTTCATHFQQYIHTASQSAIEVNGQHVPIHSFTKRAIDLLNTLERNRQNMSQLQPAIDLLNSQWRHHRSNTRPLGKLIAAVDFSPSMYRDAPAPIETAIALGIRIAERSLLGRHLMTFGPRPGWIHLSDTHDDFATHVATLTQHATTHQLPTATTVTRHHSNLYTAFANLLDTCLSIHMPPEELHELVFVILSDMSLGYHALQQEYTAIEQLYTSRNKHLRPPHLVFWNLRTDQRPPSTPSRLSTQPNITILSGYNPSMLHLFCEEGAPSWWNSTPWSMLVKCLEHPRYHPMASHFEQVMNSTNLAE